MRLFRPGAYRLTGQKLGLVSDARSRFERGVDPAFVEPGVQLATAMAIELAGGEPSQIVRAGTPPSLDKVDRLPARALRRAGRHRRAGGPAGGDLAAARLHGDPRRSLAGRRCRHGVATWTAPADIVEEVVRIEGIDQVPSTPLPRAPGVARPTATARADDRAQGAAHRGRARPQRGGDLELHLRSRGGAVRRLGLDPRQPDQRGDEGDAALAAPRPARRRRAQRRARGAESVRLFEIGRRYLGDERAADAGPGARRRAAPRHWRTGKAEPFDAFDAKAEALAILAAAGAPVDNLQVLGEASGVYHPGQSGRLCLGPRTRWPSSARSTRASLKAFDLDGPVVAAEIFLDAIPAKRGGTGHRRSLYAPPPLQAVKRDFAFLVPADLRRRPAAPRGARRRQGGDRRGAPVRRLHRPGRAGGPEVARGRGHAPARREELHRRGAEGDLRADRRRRGQARRHAAAT